MPWGLQKGILLGWFIRGQVVLQWRPLFLIKWNLTWCIFLSLSEHVQCIYQLIRAIHELWWPPMASIFRKPDVFMYKMHFFSIFNRIYIFEPLKSCTIAWYTWLMDLVTSHGLQLTSKPQNAKFFCNIFAIFCKFNFNDGLHMASGPQKGILLGGFIRGQVGLQ